MLARVGIVISTLVLLPLLSGCLQGEETPPRLEDGDTDPPPQATENVTFTFYLLFPEECPEGLIGFTTHDRNESFEKGNFCGNSPIEAGGVSHHCGSFKVHDDEFIIKNNDTLYVSVAILDWPGVEDPLFPWYATNAYYFTWRDEHGVVAEARDNRGFSPYPNNYVYPGAMSVEAVAERDSYGQIWFDIETNGHCWGMDAGGDSNFEVYRGKASCFVMDNETHCQRP